MTSAQIPSTIQDAVDQYLELYQVAKQLEDRMKELREPIETFMRDTDVQQIFDRKRLGRVQLTMSERPTVSAKYTTYDPDVLVSLVTPESLKKCLVEVVDKDRLEALITLGEVSAEVLSHKTTKPSQSFQVRLGSL